MVLRSTAWLRVVAPGIVRVEHSVDSPFRPLPTLLMRGRLSRCPATVGSLLPLPRTTSLHLLRRLAFGNSTFIGLHSECDHLACVLQDAFSIVRNRSQVVCHGLRNNVELFVHLLEDRLVLSPTISISLHLTIVCVSHSDRHGILAVRLGSLLLLLR